MDQKPGDDDHQKVGRPVYREVVPITTSRGCTYESVGRAGCTVGVKWRGENRGRRIDGEGGGRRGDEVTNQVRGIRLWGIKEGSQDTTVVGLEEVDKDDGEGGKDVVDIHGGSVAACSGVS